MRITTGINVVFKFGKFQMWKTLVGWVWWGDEEVQRGREKTEEDEESNKDKEKKWGRWGGVWPTEWKESCGMEMVQLLIIDHYPLPLLNNISLDKFKE